MPIPWEAHVQKTGELTVFPGDRMLSAPAWGLGLFRRILDEFNRLAQTNSLGVRMVIGDREPQRNGLGASVRFDVTSGPCAFFNAAGQDQRGTLDTSPGNVRGICFRPISFSGPLAKFDFSWKAFVFLPENPRIDTRTVGENVRIAVALHELFHACGLGEDDPGHGQPGSPAPGVLDLFATGGVVLQGSGAEGDQMLIGGRTVPGKNGFTITARTAGLVQSIWLLGRQ